MVPCEVVGSPRARARRLREIAGTARTALSDQLWTLADELEARADELERAYTFSNDNHD
jgi:hypothetical protein